MPRSTPSVPTRKSPKRRYKGAGRSFYYCETEIKRGVLEFAIDSQQEVNIETEKRTDHKIRCGQDVWRKINQLGWRAAPDSNPLGDFKFVAPGQNLKEAVEGVTMYTGYRALAEAFEKDGSDIKGIIKRAEDHCSQSATPTAILEVSETDSIDLSNIDEGSVSDGTKKGTTEREKRSKRCRDDEINDNDDNVTIAYGLGDAFDTITLPVENEETIVSSDSRDRTKKVTEKRRTKRRCTEANDTEDSQSDVISISSVDCPKDSISNREREFKRLISCLNQAQENDDKFQVRFYKTEVEHFLQLREEQVSQFA